MKATVLKFKPNGGVTVTQPKETNYVELHGRPATLLKTKSLVIEDFTTFIVIWEI